MKLSQTERYNILIEEFNRRPDRILDSYDKQLQNRLNKKQKTVERYLINYMNEYNSIIELSGYKRKTFKLIEPVDLIIETLKHTEGIGELIYMIYDDKRNIDPKVLSEIEALTRNDSDIYQLVNAPMEDTRSIEEKETFIHLKNAVKKREYRKITFKGERQDNLKCLKLVYMENNWYIAYVNSENKLLFGRISLIKKVEYATNTGKFQPSSVKDHLEFLKNIQNPMTLYGKPKKIAKIKANPFIARYFDENIKRQLSSQKFIEKLDDGSIIFTVEYTQPMEIFPLIQSWLPNLTILEPEDLKEKYIQRLQETITNHY